MYGAFQNNVLSWKWKHQPIVRSLLSSFKSVPCLSISLKAQRRLFFNAQNWQLSMKLRARNTTLSWGCFCSRVSYGRRSILSLFFLLCTIFSDTNQRQREIGAPAFISRGATGKGIRSNSPKRHHFPHGSACCKTIIIAVIVWGQETRQLFAVIAKTGAARKYHDKFLAKLSIKQDIYTWVYCAVSMR